MLLTERLTTAGRLAAGVAHELNNPLATIAGCAESLLPQAQGGRAGRPRRAGRLPHLPRAHRGGGVPLQGDHRQPAAVRAGAREPPGADRPQRAGRKDHRAALAPVAVHCRAVRHRAGCLAVRGDGERGAAAPGVPGPGLERAGGHGRPRQSDHPHAAGAPRDRDRVRGRGAGNPRGDRRRASSTRSSPPSRRGRGRGWAWPSPRASWPTTEDASRCNRMWARAASSAWCCRHEPLDPRPGGRRREEPARPDRPRAVPARARGGGRGRRRGRPRPAARDSLRRGRARHEDAREGRHRGPARAAGVPRAAAGDRHDRASRKCPPPWRR